MSFCYGFSQNTFPTAVNTAVGIGTGTTAVSGAGGLRLKVTSGTEGNSGIQLTNVTSSTATVTGNNKALSVDATGKIILTPVVNITPVITNIYNSNGVLTTNRIVDLNSNNLTFNPSNVNSQFFINGKTGNVGIGNIFNWLFIISNENPDFLIVSFNSIACNTDTSKFNGINIKLIAGDCVPNPKESNNC